MKVLYIGQYGEGSTSRMRGENLQRILNTGTYDVINIDIPIYQANPFVRSFGWRFNAGPLMKNINQYIRSNIKGSYDLIWVDKGIFIDPALVKEMKAGCKVHYTPDTAIVYNKSRSFFGSIPFYNYCITTKSFELDAYREKGAQEVLFCTQGYDSRIHRQYTAYEDKKGVVFVGLCEKEREQVISELLGRRIHITLAGAKWDKFAEKFRNNPFLNYLGEGIYGEAYARVLSKGQLGLGLLSKRFPEKHTTRTLEIPACGTALISEMNEDMRTIFREDEAIFYKTTDEMIESIIYALQDREYLSLVTQKGFQKITNGGFDYSSILRKLLNTMNLI